MDSFKEYQQGVLRTATKHEDKRLAFANWSMGLAGEAGELVDMIKKVIFHQHAMNPAAIGKELGDVLWYAAVLAHEVGLDLGDIAQQNLEKLQARYPNGFDPERSKNRVEYQQTNIDVREEKSDGSGDGVAGE